MAFAHYVKLEPDTHNHNHHQQQRHYYFGGGRETSSSPGWPSSPPLPDFTTHAAGASRPPSATGFLSSSMNFLANVVADPTSGAAPAELFKLRARDADTVESLVSVLAASTTTNAGSPPPDLAGAAGSPTPATPPPPSLSSSLSLTSSSASCPVRPRAPRRSVKGTSGGATSPGVARRHHHPTSPYAWDHQHQHQHHQPVVHHPHPHQHHHREVYGQQPPAHTGHYHPYLHAPSVVPVAPCHHHHPQFPTPPSAYAHVSGHNFVSTNHQHSGNSDHWPGHFAAHQPLHDQHAATGRPMFWSSSTGVVTRATTPISRTMSGEDSEISSAGATTTSVAATSAAVAAAATALIRAHATQQLRKRRRSQSAPPPRDQAIFVPRNGRQVRRQCDGVDNSSDCESRAPAMALAATSGAVGPSSPYSSPMMVSSPQSCVENCYGQSATTSSPPTSPTGVASRTSTTKRSDIYGLLN